jgi:hypothetical protein
MGGTCRKGEAYKNIYSIVGVQNRTRVLFASGTSFDDEELGLRRYQVTHPS